MKTYIEVIKANHENDSTFAIVKVYDNNPQIDGELLFTMRFTISIDDSDLYFDEIHIERKQLERGADSKTVYEAMEIIVSTLECGAIEKLYEGAIFSDDEILE